MSNIYVGNIDGSQNWRWSKLTVGNIDGGQNWRWPKLTVGKIYVAYINVANINVGNRDRGRYLRGQSGPWSIETVVDINVVYRDRGQSGPWAIFTWAIFTWAIFTWAILTWPIGTVANINVAKRVPLHTTVASAEHGQCCSLFTFSLLQNYRLVFIIGLYL